MNNFRKMKFLILTAVICFGIFYKVNSQTKDAPLDYYPEQYDTLSQEDWPAIKETFDFFLSFKSLNEINNYTDPQKASFILARMTKINWNETLKNEVTSYLSYFLDQLLQGHSYLNIDIIKFPQYVSIHNPLYLPHIIIWALFQIDCETACEIIKTYWSTTPGLAINSYQEDLRGFMLWLFENTNIKTAEEFFLNNYTLLKNNSSSYEKETISRIKLKFEISKINDQKQAWEYLWTYSKLDSTGVFDDKAQFLWYHNILLMQDIFQEIDTRTIIKISDTTFSVNKKYIFLYSACFNINTQLSRDPNYKIDRSIINYLDRAITKMEGQRTSLKSVSSGNDFLLSAYDSMKSNLSKKGDQ